MGKRTAIVLVLGLLAIGLALAYGPGGNLGRGGNDVNPPPHAVQQ